MQMNCNQWDTLTGPRPQDVMIWIKWKSDRKPCFVKTSSLNNSFSWHSIYWWLLIGQLVWSPMSLWVFVLLGIVLLGDCNLEEITSLFDLGVLDAELPNRIRDVLALQCPRLDHVGQKDDDYAHLSILLHVLWAWLVALVHAILHKEESEDFRNANVLLHVVEDVEQVDGEAHRG